MDRDAFLALASIIWADGVVLEAEAVAMRAAARACGLSADEQRAVERAIGSPVALDELSIGELTDSDGELIYAIACWLAAVDGTIYDVELAAVEEVADLLELSTASRERGQRSSVNIAAVALNQGRGGAVLDLLRQLEERRGQAHTHN